MFRLARSTKSITRLTIPKRRWRQTSLRTLSVFLLIIGRSDSVRIDRKVQRIRNEQDAVAEIRKMERRLRNATGNRYCACRTLGFSRSLFMEFNWIAAGSRTRAWYALKDLPDLEWLELGGTEITDDGLEHLGALTDLERLELGGTQVTDAGLEHLNWHPQPEIPDPSGTPRPLPKVSGNSSEFYRIAGSIVS